MHPETRYKLCKFCENRARDTTLRGVYIPHFDQISVKISVFSVLYPYRCVNEGEIWHAVGDLQSPSPCQISPSLVQLKTLKIGLLSKLNNRRFALRAMLPVNNQMSCFLQSIFRLCVEVSVGLLYASNAIVIKVSNSFVQFVVDLFHNFNDTSGV